MRLRKIGIMATALAVLVGTGSAHALTVRTDPNDTPSRPDIRKVWSDTPRGKVFISIGAWERVRSRDDFRVLLDTHGGTGYDRLIDVVVGRCVMYEVDEAGFVGEMIGERKSRRPSKRSRACRLPGGWFDIEKAVRFAVLNAELGFPATDRAPNRGRYLGL